MQFIFFLFGCVSCASSFLKHYTAYRRRDVLFHGFLLSAILRTRAIAQAAPCT